MRTRSRRLLEVAQWGVLAAVFLGERGFAQNAAEPGGAQAAGQQAVNVILQQYVRDSAALNPKTGQPLPANGSWSVGTRQPDICPKTTESCLRVLYRIPADGVSCEWVVLLVGDGTSGTVLEQNEDATRYLVREIGKADAQKMIITRKVPGYPPIAAAAHVEGPVLLAVVVDASGKPGRVSVLSGPEMLRWTAEQGAKDWRFQPLKVGSRAVPFQTNVTFVFRTRGPSSSSVTSEP